jgi:hypothetical protein
MGFFHTHKTRVTKQTKGSQVAGVPMSFLWIFLISQKWQNYIEKNDFPSFPQKRICESGFCTALLIKNTTTQGSFRSRPEQNVQP